MIVVDTGPLIALFNAKDAAHARCVHAFKGLREYACTTVPALTEAFHILGPASSASDRLRDLILRKGVAVWFLDSDAISRAFELMETYADHPMDFADASVVAAAESLGTRKVFTLDRNDFETYRVRLGHRHHAFEILS